MKRAFCLIAFALAVTLSSQAGGAPAAAVPVFPSNSGCLSAGTTNGLGVPRQLFRSTPLLLDTNLPRGSCNISDLPKPGIYKASPYTMIVIVPGPHPDERKAPRFLPQYPKMPTMPTLKPDLKLIPIERAPQGGFSTRSLTNSPSR